MSFAQLSLKGRALRLLAAREHSRFELITKLQKYEEQAGTLAAALDELEAKGFISEARVVSSTLHQKAAKLGTARVLHELKAKRIDAAAIKEAAEQLKSTEFDRALALWQRKFGQASPNGSTATPTTKQARFLASRGFSGEAIARVLRRSQDETFEF